MIARHKLGGRVWDRFFCEICDCEIRDSIDDFQNPLQWIGFMRTKNRHLYHPKNYCINSGRKFEMPERPTTRIELKDLSPKR